VAARVTVDRKPPAPKKRRKTQQGDGDRFTARNFAADYLRLCQNPTKDLRRWIAEDKKKGFGSGRRIETTARRETTHAHDAIKNPPLADADRLCRQPLQQLRGGLDAHGRERGQADNLFARSRAGPHRYDGLRSVRGQADAGSLGPLADDRAGPDLSFRDERSALSSLYAGKIEVLKRNLPAREIAAAIRALLDERSAAFRALGERRQAAATLSERRAAERFAERERRRRNEPHEQII